MLANATGRMAAAYWPPHGDDDELPLTDQQRGRAAA